MKVWVKCGKVHVPIVLGPAMKLLQCHSLWGPAWSLCEILLSPSMNSNTRSAQGGSLRQAEICLLQRSALKCILKPFGWTLQVDRFKDVGTVLTVLQLRIWHLVSGYVKGFEAIAVLWWLQILSVMCRTSLQSRSTESFVFVWRIINNWYHTLLLVFFTTNHRLDQNATASPPVT